MNAPMKPEIIYDLSFADYRAIPALNWSLLKEIDDSPGRLDWRRRNPWTPSPAAILGNAIHTWLLEPAEFARRYVTVPVHQEDLPDHFVPVPPEYLGKRGAWLKAGQEWKALQEAAGKVPVKPGEWKGAATSTNSTIYKEWRAWAQAQGVTVLSHAMAAQADGATREVLGYEPAAAILAASKREVSMVWQDVETGLWCKGRMDCWDGSTSTEADVKTTGQSVHHGSFGRTAHLGGVHIQRAFYGMGVESITGRPVEHHKIIAVEVDEPWRCEVYRMGLAELELGHAHVRAMLDRYAFCHAFGEWPLNSGQVLPLNFPGWAFKEDS